jgi:hypothetical protein
MIGGIIGLVFAVFLLLQGFASLRRPLEVLVRNDPIGKKMIEKRGEKFTLRVYRIYGGSFVLLGLVTAYISLGLLRQ